MSWIADAHNEWHTVNGWDVCCPLDCGVGEGMEDPTPGDDAPAAEWEAYAAELFEASEYFARRDGEADNAPDPWAAVPF